MTNHKNFINIFIEEILDYWDSAGIIIGNIMGIYGVVDTFLKLGLPYSNTVLGIGFLVYSVSGLFYMAKVNKFVRDRDEEINRLKSSLENSESQFKDLQIALANSSANKEAERLKQPEIIFPNRFHHFEFTIKGSSPEQIINHIKDSISNLWLAHMKIDKIGYHVDYFSTKFYDPQKDNTSLYGIIFDTIKYRLGNKEDGTLTMTEIEKIHDMFSVSITYNGFGNEIKSTIRFDTHDKEAIVFYSRLKEELGKKFEIITKGEGWVISAG